MAKLSCHVLVFLAIHLSTPAVSTELSYKAYVVTNKQLAVDFVESLGASDAYVDLSIFHGSSSHSVLVKFSKKTDTRVELLKTKSESSVYSTEIQQTTTDSSRSEPSTFSWVVGALTTALNQYMPGTADQQTTPPSGSSISTSSKLPAEEFKKGDDFWKEFETTDNIPSYIPPLGHLVNPGTLLQILAAAPEKTDFIEFEQAVTLDGKDQITEKRLSITLPGGYTCYNRHYQHWDNDSKNTEVTNSDSFTGHRYPDVPGPRPMDSYYPCELHAQGQANGLDLARLSISIAATKKGETEEIWGLVSLYRHSQEAAMLDVTSQKKCWIPEFVHMTTDLAETCNITTAPVTGHNGEEWTLTVWPDNNHQTSFTAFSKKGKIWHTLVLKQGDIRLVLRKR